MKIQILVILITCFCKMSFAQFGGQSFDKLPDNNLMVDTTLTILKTLKKGDLNKLTKDFNLKIQSNDHIDSIKFFIKNGEISDTTMVEHYDNTDSSTEIKFSIDCTKFKKDLLYKLIARSDGVEGSIINYRIELIKDTVSLRQKRDFEKFFLKEK